jgi:hypothetical protein
VLEQTRMAFVEKFGREPGPSDPLFFDPDADTPQPINPKKMLAGIVVSMIKAGLPHPIIYAYIRTGLIVTEESALRLPDEDREEWDEAIEEYYRSFEPGG